MVGEETRGMKLSAITRHIAGKSYCLGECDCFSIVRDYAASRGVDLPTVYRGINIFNEYADLWKADPVKAKELMVRGFAEYCKEIPVHAMKAGDVLYLRYKDATFPAIHGGNGQALTASPEMGVTMIRITNYEILGVYRCQV